MPRAVATALILLLVTLANVASATTTTDCVNITSPMKLVIPNTINNPTGNSNGLAGNAKLIFDTTGAVLSNIQVSYAFCSSTNPLIASHVTNFRFRSFINQTSYLDRTVPACDGIQGFCVVDTPDVGCLTGLLTLNSTWPMLTAAAAPQIWIIGDSNLAYGRFKTNAEHTYADGPAALTFAAVSALF